jgi:hypothetical protein
MSIRDQLLKENSKKNWQLVAKAVGTDKKLFRELMELYFNDSYRVVQRAAQVISDIADEHPEMLKPYRSKMIDHLEIDSIDAVRRNTMRIFQFCDIPQEKEGELFEKGIWFLKSAETPVAVKAFSMTVLRRICEKYPELSGELIPHIEILVEENASAGLVNRGKKELQKLNALKKTSS